MSKPEPKKASAFDVRVIQRNIAQGSVSAADHKAYLDALPDVANKAEPIHVSQPGQGNEDDDEGND